MKVIWSKDFTENVHYYIRKKKYKKIEQDFMPVIDELEAGNLIGDKLEDLHLDEGTAAYKVRVANSSANVGKSNGFRIIYMDDDDQEHHRRIKKIRGHAALILFACDCVDPSIRSRSERSSS